MGAGGYFPRAIVPMGRGINAPSALQGDVESEPLSVDFDAEQIETLSSCIEVIRFL
jgi:hypothetical protein